MQIFIRSQTRDKSVISSTGPAPEAEPLYRNALIEAKGIQNPHCFKTAMFESYTIYDFKRGIQEIGYLIDYSPDCPWAVIGRGKVFMTKKKKDAVSIFVQLAETEDCYPAKKGYWFLDNYSQSVGVIDLRKQYDNKKIYFDI